MGPRSEEFAHDHAPLLLLVDSHKRSEHRSRRARAAASSQALRRERPLLPNPSSLLIKHPVVSGQLVMRAVTSAAAKIAFMSNHFLKYFISFV